MMLLSYISSEACQSSNIFVIAMSCCMIVQGSASDATLEEASNHCRNPDGKSGPWCYSNHPNKSWEFCDVKPCLSKYIIMFFAFCVLSCGFRVSAKNNQIKEKK